MAACERCWTQAVRLAHYTGKTTNEHYHDLLAKNEGPDGHHHKEAPDE